MKELQRKQRMRKLMYSVPSLALITLLSLALAKGAYGVFAKERESARVVKELEDKASSSELREQELEASIAKLQTEEGIVEEIKDKFSVTRAGEHVAVIVDERPKASSTAAASHGVFGSFWDKLKSLWPGSSKVIMHGNEK